METTKISVSSKQFSSQSDYRFIVLTMLTRKLFSWTLAINHRCNLLSLQTARKCRKTVLVVLKGTFLFSLPHSPWTTTLGIWTPAFGSSLPPCYPFALLTQRGFLIQRGFLYQPRSQSSCAFGSSVDCCFSLLQVLVMLQGSTLPLV